jgi:hypothetical protein
MKGSIGKSKPASQTISIKETQWKLMTYRCNSGSYYPFCSTLVLYGQEYTSSGTYSFLSYSCKRGSGTKVTAFQTTHDFSTTSSSTTSSPSSKDSSSPDASTPSPTSSAATSSAVSLPPTDPATATTSATAQNASGGLSQGGQIGIGVGVGFAVGGALIAASLWLWRRRGTRNTLQNDTYHAHYGDTGDHYMSPPGVGHQGYSDDALRKQDSEHFAPVELTSAPVHHELDGTYRR